jgi:NADH-ubiquinone oxidoreductase chain 5
MLLLINFTNLWIFIWGWDFLGVVSYILVISYQNQNSRNAGMITVLSNRVGDSFMIIRVSLLTLTGNWNSIINNNQNFNILLTAIILTRITKSAQIPFCAWLPAAMAAPTPVSALVHSSTLVTAGVYLVIRFNQNNPSLTTLLIGIITTILAGINACNGFDFKKLIALSTLSQLGLMFIALGLGNYKLALYHLVTHGLVKALLFLSAGLVIHQTKRNQDLRLITGLMQSLPLTATCIILTRLTLSGLPFMTCFFSKEVIINQNFIKSFWIIVRIYIAARLTINYRLRLIYRIFKSPSLWNRNSFTEKSFNTLIPLIGLLPFSVCWGASNFWFFLPVLQTNIQFNIIFTLLTWTIIILSIYLGFTLFSNKNWRKTVINRLITNLLFLPLLSSNFVNQYTKTGFSIIKNIETSWSESLGAQGTYRFLTKFMLNRRNRFIIIYLLRILFWLLLVICLFSL